MAAELPEAGMVALCIALGCGLGCAEILKPVLHFLEGAPARGPALDHSVLLIGFTIVMVYLAGVVLIYLHLTPAAGTSVALAAFRQYFVLVCILFVPFLFLASGGW